jgi:Fe-S oxidoreductase
MISFNLFVLPFLFGLIYGFFTVNRRLVLWVKTLPREERKSLWAGIRSRRVFPALGDILMECLVHRSLFKRNKLLGFMHMSFALGWFLLILFGNMESRIYSTSHVNPPYYPIFLKFFIHDKTILWFEINTVPGFFRFIMDFFLLFTLSGLGLALVKRKQPQWFGLKQVPHYQLTDKVAIGCLWLIFPLRLLAESFTNGYFAGGGGFITQHLGNTLVTLFPSVAIHIAYGFWWAYSLALGVFFVTLPFSRFMHIPSEFLLILFRHFGLGPKKVSTPFTDVEVHACSRCGVCIDVCQLGTAAGMFDVQAVYFIRSVRDNHVQRDLALRCLVCGRCQEVCPVRIHTDSIRLIERNRYTNDHASEFTYLKPGPVAHSEIIYFAGCMTHLTPGIIHAMKGILNQAGISYLFLDEQRTACCGRPLMLAGKHTQAISMMEHNRAEILSSGAKLLVTSCPICYRVFREEYGLSIRILHHSQYILELIKTGKIPLQSYYRKVAYHDPCDLGRGTSEYSAPRELLAKVADLTEVSEERADSLCCGGSLGIYTVSPAQRDLITKETLSRLTASQPEVLATACPLCKKTFAKHADIEVMDIAEMVFASIPTT